MSSQGLGFDVARRAPDVLFFVPLPAADCSGQENRDAVKGPIAQLTFHSRRACAGQPARMVFQDCQVMRRMTIVIASPIRGSAIGSPMATAVAEAMTARLT